MPRHKPDQPIKLEHKRVPFFLIKADAATGIVDAIVSVMGIVDLGQDVIHRGAYTKTIRERKGKIRVLDNHRTASTLDAVGVPIELREIGREELPPEILMQYPEATGGLYTRTQFLINTPEGRGVFDRIVSDAINEWSIGFESLQQDYGKVKTPDGKEIPVRNIRQIKLWEYSAVLWGMNPATTTTDAKAMADASNYRLVEPTAANRCAACRFYREINNENGYCKRFDFVASANWTCDAFAASKGVTPDEQMEFTPDGAKTRLGDYLAGATYSKLMECVNGFLTDGYVDADEHRQLCEMALRVMDVIRAGVPEDVALRPYSRYGDMLFMFGNSPATDEKSGRVLSARTAADISSAVDKLVDLLVRAGVYPTPDDEDEAEDDASKSQAGAPPEASTAPDWETIMLEAELLTIEIQGG